MVKHPLRLLVSLLLCHSAGIIGSLFTVSAIPGWYETLQKPSFTPPSFVFAPVWLLLYTLIGIALYLVWQKGLEKPDARRAFWLFIFHLVINALWSILFFGFHLIFLALLDSILLLALILILLILGKKIDPRIQYLFLPYLAWVSFATVLNFVIWQLN